MVRHVTLPAGLALALSVVFAVGAGRASAVSFEPGDVFVSLEFGPVQWWRADGTLNRVLIGTVPGTGEGMAFDSFGNLYVTRWCMDPPCNNTGNTVEMFDVVGRSLGPVGSGYNCSPHAILFTATNTAYIGQAGCSGDILKVAPGEDRNPVSFDVEPEFSGSFWIDLAADGCTMLYTSFGPNVKRYDVCSGVQLGNLNAMPLPGGVTHDVRALADGGAIVASGEIIVRLDAAGAIAQTYAVAGEPSYWAGVELTVDGAFWAANYQSSKVHKFDLGSGERLATLDTAMPTHTVVAVRVKR